MAENTSPQKGQSPRPNGAKLRTSNGTPCDLKWARKRDTDENGAHDPREHLHTLSFPSGPNDRCQRDRRWRARGDEEEEEGEGREREKTCGAMGEMEVGRRKEMPPEG